MNNKKTTCVILAACASVATGCASNRLEQEFGDSVREVMTKQIYDPGAALSPDRNAVTGGDPTRLEGVVESHRGDVVDPGRVERPVSVDINSGSRR